MDYWFSKYNRVLLHYSVSIAAATAYIPLSAAAAAYIPLSAAAYIPFSVATAVVYIPLELCHKLTNNWKGPYIVTIASYHIFQGKPYEVT
jgi:hypothetical protein